uniref:Prostaglandin-H2 D-isomerase n=1 Tax=Athene cunicularia TaxID=194338 RepID=A0A663NDH3_ATHCN
MHATLFSILGLALLGALHAQDSFPVQTDFQQDKLTGRWYSIGLASNSNWFKEKKHLMKMCTTVISVTADGNLEVTSTYPKGDQCEKRNSLYTKTEQPGRFSYTSPRWGSKHDIRVVETNYDEYALVATQISKSTGSSTMVLLYSKSALRPPCCPLHCHPGVPQDVLGGGSLPWEQHSVISQAGVSHGMAGSGPLCWAACTLGQYDPSLRGGGGCLSLCSLCRPDKGAQS